MGAITAAGKGFPLLEALDIFGEEGGDEAEMEEELPDDGFGAAAEVTGDL